MPLLQFVKFVIERAYCVDQCLIKVFGPLLRDSKRRANPESEPASEAIQSGDGRRIFGQCVPRVVTHYPVEIWLWPSPEGKEGQLCVAPTPRRSSAGRLKYRQCVLEKCESDIQYRRIP
ncbi:hypothetical protein TNCV_2529151 [Trichonephila clavipes]|nr:hypothetical protein TNCV_2529151 [Trichonephila clavipes]